MSFRKRTIFNVLQLGGYSYIAQALSFFSTIILARLLLPEEFGFVAMIMVVTNFASIFTGIGIGSDIIRNPFGYTYHKSMMNLSLLIGIILTLIVILSAYPLAWFFGNSKLVLPTIIVSVKFVFSSLNVVYFSLMMKKQEYILAGKIRLYSTVVTIIGMVVMAYLGFSYWSLILPLIVGEVLLFLLGVYYVKLKVKIYPLKYSVVAFRYARSIIGSIMGVRIVSYWGRNLDNILIGRFYGEVTLGIYNRGYRFIDLVSGQIERLFDSVLYPNLQVLKEKNGNVYNEYLFFVGLISLIGYPVSFLLVLFPEVIVKVLWGRDWLMVAEYLPYFGISIMSQLSVSNSETMYKLYYKDLLLFGVGIFRSITIVVFIIIGSIISPIMVAKLIALSQVVVILPVTVYYSFGVGMGFNYRVLNRFFLPKILIAVMIFIAQWYNNYTLTFAFMLLYLAHLIIDQISDIRKFRDFLFSFRKKKLSSGS